MLFGVLLIVLAVSAFIICAAQVVAQSHLAARAPDGLLWRELEPSELPADVARRSGVARPVSAADDDPSVEVRSCPALAELVPLNHKTRRSVSGHSVPLHTMPFRLGRECRIRMADGRAVTTERRRGAGRPNNDLYMLNPGKRLFVSREHFQIIRTPDGRYLLQDRGSRCGTCVEDRLIGGGDRSGECELKDGDTIRVGGMNSPFVFKFRCLT